MRYPSRSAVFRRVMPQAHALQPDTLAGQIRELLNVQREWAADLVIYLKPVGDGVGLCCTMGEDGGEDNRVLQVTDLE